MFKWRNKEIETDKLKFIYSRSNFATKHVQYVFIKITLAQNIILRKCNRFYQMQIPNARERNKKSILLLGYESFSQYSSYSTVGPYCKKNIIILVKKLIVIYLLFTLYNGFFTYLVLDVANQFKKCAPCIFEFCFSPNYILTMEERLIKLSSLSQYLALT